MDILEDDSKNVKLKINKEYAKKYTYLKNKQLLDEEKELLEETSSSEDDEDAILANDKVQEKFIITLDKIKKKDPAIYDPKHVFFDDEDFEDSNNEAKDDNQAKNRKITYTDLLRTNLLEKGPETFVEYEENIEKQTGNMNKLMRVTSEALEAKESFLKAFKETSNEGESVDDILTIVPSTDRRYEHKINNKVIKTKLDEEIMLKHWESDNLSKDDQFLRDYILYEKWKDNAAFEGTRAKSDVAEEEDEEERTELFEHAYNYRYQEPNGTDILTYGRDILDTVRRLDEKRKRKREKKKLKKLEEERIRKEKLRIIKELKTKDAKEKLELIARVTGIPANQLDINLESPFNPESHDKEMSKIFGKEYYEQKDALKGKELLADTVIESEVYPEEQTKHAHDSGLEDHYQGRSRTEVGAPPTGDTEEQPASNTNNPPPIEEEEGGNLGSHSGDEYIWWMCDHCGGGILEGHRRFDCTECDNYTLCKACMPLANHEHKLVRKKVPRGHKPPPGYDVTSRIGRNLANIDDEYGFEDIIGGELPVKFKYRDVVPEDMGIAVEDILTADDKELKRKCPIKKLLAYQ